MKQFSVEVPDNVGSLAKVTEALARGAVNIQALASERRNGQGLIHVVTNDERSTREILEKEYFNFNECDILVLSLMDRPGELSKYARKLSDAGVNVDNVYILSTKNGKTEVALNVNDSIKAKKAIR